MLRKRKKNYSKFAGKMDVTHFHIARWRNGVDSNGVLEFVSEGQEFFHYGFKRM